MINNVAEVLYSEQSKLIKHVNRAIKVIHINSCDLSHLLGYYKTSMIHDIRELLFLVPVMSDNLGDTIFGDNNNAK